MPPLTAEQMPIVLHELEETDEDVTTASAGGQRVCRGLFPRPGLKGELLFGRPFYHYLMVSNLALRLAWLYKLWAPLRHSHAAIMLFALLEVWFGRFTHFRLMSSCWPFACTPYATSRVLPSIMWHFNSSALYHAALSRVLPSIMWHFKSSALYHAALSRVLPSIMWHFKSSALWHAACSSVHVSHCLLF
jgi:hypothetical protein